MAAPAFGDYNFWADGAVGAWDSGNWSGGIPDNTDYVCVGAYSSGETPQVNITTETAIANEFGLGSTYVGSYATLSMTGGSLTTGDFMKLGGYAGSETASSGTVTQSVGSVSVGTDLHIGYWGGTSTNVGQYTISSGSLSVSDYTLIGADTARNGTLTVSGTTSSISLGSLYMNGTMEFILNDTTTGVTKVVGTTLNQNNTIQKLTGMISVNDLDRTNTLGDKIDILQLTNETTIDYSSLSIDNSNWELTSDGNTLQIEYVVPEPATMMLLGIGGIGVLIRRRRR